MSLKKSFSKDNKTCTVTFIVSKEAAQGAKTINLAGDFNSWSSTDTPLTLGNDGSFSVSLDLAADREYQFRLKFTKFSRFSISFIKSIRLSLSGVFVVNTRVV